MRKLALSDEILLSVDKAARYIGGEVNSIMKDKDKVTTRVAFSFPDVYEIGMSNLGMMLLYNMFNKRPDIWCERVYSPWLDLDKIMREQKITWIRDVLYQCAADTGPFPDSAYGKGARRIMSYRHWRRCMCI